MTSSSGDLLEQARAGYAETAGRSPRRRLAVVTCMDARVDPLPALGARLGDAHVIRNAGGVVTDDVLRSLVVSQRRLDTTAVDLMMHTDCGMLNLDEAALRTEIAAASGGRVVADFRAFADLEAELRRGVGVIRATKALPNRDKVRGLIYDVATNRVRVVIT